MIEFIRNENTLMAYVDGELNAPLAAALEEEMRRDPQLVSELVGFIRTRRIAKAALMSSAADVGGVEIPEALREKPHIASARPTSKRSPRQILLAAGLAVAAFLGGAMLGQLQPGGTLALVESPEMAKVLNSRPSGSEMDLEGRTLRVVGTFQSLSAVCREAEISGGGERTSAVMCKSGDSWKPALTVAVRERGYEPAAGPTLVDGYLSGIGAERVTEAAELQLLAKGSRGVTP